MTLDCVLLYIFQQAFWVIYNLTAGTRDQVQRVFDEGFLPTIVHGLSDVSVNKSYVK